MPPQHALARLAPALSAPTVTTAMQAKTAACDCDFGLDCSGGYHHHPAA